MPTKKRIRPKNPNETARDHRGPRQSTCHISPKPDDWFAQAVRRHRQRAAQDPALPLSKLWRARPREEVAENLRICRDVVRNLVRAHGAPKQCRVELALLGQLGAGAATFEDAPASFEKPVIYLDKQVWESCNPQVALDVYCGLGIHEAGHVLHTRRLYRQGQDPEKQTAPAALGVRFWQNWFEDVRIEGLARQESPGFAVYLDVAIQQLIVKRELGQAIEHWDDLPDLDRLRALMCAFVRCPWLIDCAVDLQQWRAINGECVFDTLRTVFPEAPRSERAVMVYAAAADQLYRRIENLYAEESGEGQDSTAPPADTTEPPENEKRPSETNQTSADEGDAVGPPSDVAGHPGGVPPDAALDMRLGRRFGRPEMNRMIDRFTIVRRPLDQEEAETVDRADRERVTLAEAWSWDGTRETVIRHPVPGQSHHDKYEAARCLVRGHVAAMRRVLRLRLGQRSWRERQQVSGRLDRRNLGQAWVTDRLFYRNHTRSGPGIALCLLLDESSSMDSCRTAAQVGSSTKAATALRVAVLVAESLRGIPGVALEIYSHTSCGRHGADCLVRYLFGKSNPHPASIGAYGDGAVNYDHQAILTAARMFEANTNHGNRIMLVVSDGHPNGWNYGGSRAIRATREAVDSVRQRGIRLLAIAIEDYDSESIYGPRHVVHCSQLGQLVGDMRKLITNVAAK
jgi:hypothetical protein